jgi:nucleotide-binding universal stress UspA family protein
MKNIVVPTDFSNNAENALKYAINLAIHFGSKIHLITSFEAPSQAGSLVSIRDFLRKDAEEELSKVVNKYQDRFIKGSSMETKAIEGYTSDVISGYAKKCHADLIVMGTQGASALKGTFMGSNTAAVIKGSTVPVLAIPEGFGYQTIKEIVLAIDDKVITSQDVLQPLLTIAKEYKAHVNVLHVEKALVPVDDTDDGLGLYLNSVPHSFNMVYNDDVKESVDHFVKKIDGDLLCMIHRKRGFWGNLFHRSTVSKESFDSPVPLLVLYDEN